MLPRVASYVQYAKSNQNPNQITSFQEIWSPHTFRYSFVYRFFFQVPNFKFCFLFPFVIFKPVYFFLSQTKTFVICGQKQIKNWF
jgi:hypothetical protein